MYYSPLICTMSSTIYITKTDIVALHVLVMLLTLHYLHDEGMLPYALCYINQIILVQSALELVKVCKKIRRSVN